MRILWLITRYWPVLGGAELHSRQVIHELSRRGHEICVVSHWDTNRTDWLRGTTLFAPGAALRYRDGEATSVVRLGSSTMRRLRTVGPALTYYLRQPRAAGALAALLESDIQRLCGDRWDVIHGVRVGREPLYLAGYRLARRLGVPYVFTPLHHPRWAGPRHRLYLDLYRRADALIALTEYERGLFREVGVADERIQVTGIGPILPAAADGDRFRAAHRLTGPLVLFLGQKYDYKGYETLLAAAKRVWSERADVTFAFLGPRTPASRLAFAAARDRRILELGAVDLQVKGDALAACDVFCMPPEQESFGGVYTEAWSYCKPVVGCAIPAVREVISDGVDGLLAPPRDAAALARCIERLLDLPRLREDMGRAGEAKVRLRYQWSAVAQRTERAYARAQVRVFDSERR
jgi:glycosyltransferase involved in cell wall biosynthesis